MPRSLKIEFSPDAVIDLDRLKAFIGVHDPKAAARAANKILEAIRKIRDFPLVGKPINDMEHLPLRDLFIHFGQGGYWLRYAVSDKTITVIRIWHGREDRNF